MDKPDKQPTRDMLSAYSVGVILSMTFNKDATDESRAQAEHDSGYCGSFDYEMIFDLVGSSGTCSIGEYTVELLEFNVGSGGGWILDRNTRVLCRPIFFFIIFSILLFSEPL